MFTINYALETGLCWLFFYLIYVLLLRKETFFRGNRIYLMGTLLLGLLIPAIDFIPAQPSATVQHFTMYLNEVTVLANGNITTPDSSLDIKTGLLFIYKIGLAFFFLRFLVGIGGIFRLFIGSKIVRKENYTLVYTRREHAPFSFMQFFFVYQNMDFNEQEWKQVVLHESTHIAGGHTLDVLLTEVLAILFWFNPLIYLYKNAIRNVHEYLADAAVIKTVPMVHYGRLLVTHALPGFRMANNFNHSQLKQRIIMMKKMQSPRYALAKYTFLIPVALLMLFVFSCQEPATQEEIISEVTETAKKQSAETAKLSEKAIKVTADKSPDGRTDIYSVVDQMPLFPGCDAAEYEARRKCAEKEMLQHIYTNIVYPAEARDAGIEGMAVVSFIVEKDGSITNTTILRSLSAELDEEVLRVVGLMPHWMPGKQAGETVAVKFHLPVRFKLEN